MKLPHRPRLLPAPRPPAPVRTLVCPRDPPSTGGRHRLTPPALTSAGTARAATAPARPPGLSPARPGAERPLTETRRAAALP